MSEDLSLLSEDDFITLPQKKLKVLLLSDHPLATSGVGVQARFLVEGLLKTGRYSFRCLGGAMKHQNYETVVVNPDFIIKPVDGFGNHQMVRQILLTERPDVLLIFTDPRQFIWLWEIEDEIHQICPISYWHVWDNDPYPSFNKVWYDSTDLINCLSHKTYGLVQPNFPEKTNYIPHAFPKHVYHKLPADQLKEIRQKHFGHAADWFIALWVNRNATRKMPNDLLNAWKLFLDDLEKEEGHRNALLFMHTDPNDTEGPNLIATADLLGLKGNVVFSVGKLEFQDMNILYNVADVTVNISKAEGFGLSTLAAMQVGRPIIVSNTGGHMRQIFDYRDGFEHGVSVEPAARTLVGSQLVPFIYDDHVNYKDVAAAFKKIYKLTPEERDEIGKRAMEYVDHEFNYDKMVDQWDKSLTKLVNEFKTKKQGWSLTNLEAVQEQRQTLTQPTQPPPQSQALKQTPLKQKIDVESILSRQPKKVSK